MSKITIANPIYDVVFKYLLEDLDIAKGLISRILGCEIESLEVHSQETQQETNLPEIPGLRLLRLDFKAVIWVKEEENLEKSENENPKKTAKKKINLTEKTEGGAKYERKKVLIELQKSKELFDILRFRKYLAENYSKADTIMISAGKNQTEVLPIVTIYFLGFLLEHIPFPVLKVGKQFQNVLKGTNFELKKREDFVDLLTHESYMIQILRLEDKLLNPLEKILLLFNQKYRLKEDKHRLFIEENVGDILVEKAQSRLARAAGDEDFRKKMDIEDEMERTVLAKFKAFEAQIEEEKQRAETEKERADAAENLLKEEERRKEAEKERADAAENLLKEEERRKEAEKQRADAAENLLKEEERRKEAEKQRADAAENLLKEQEAKIAALLKELKDKENKE